MIYCISISGDMKTCQHQLEIMTIHTSNQGMNNMIQSFFLDRICFHLEPIVNEKRLENRRNKEKSLKTISIQKQVIVRASQGITLLDLNKET